MNLDFESSKIYVDEKSLQILKYTKYKAILVNALPLNQLRSSENLILFISSHLSSVSKELLELRTKRLSIITFISEYSHLNTLDESLTGRWNVETDTYFEAVKTALSKTNEYVDIHYFSPAIWFSKNSFVLNSNVFPIFNEIDVHVELSDLLDFMNIKEVNDFSNKTVYYLGTTSERIAKSLVNYSADCKRMSSDKQMALVLIDRTVDLDLRSDNLLDLIHDIFPRKDIQVQVPCELLLSKYDEDADAVFTTCHGMDQHTMFIIDSLLNVDDEFEFVQNQLQEFLFNIGEQEYKDLECLVDHEPFLVLLAAIIDAKKNQNLELKRLDDILTTDSYMYQLIDLLKSKRFKIRDLLLLTMRMYNISKEEIDPYLEETLKKEFVVQMTADPQKRKATFMWIQKVFQQFHKIRSNFTKRDIIKGLFEQSLFKCASSSWIKRNVFDFQKIMVFYVGGYRHNEVKILTSKGREYGHELIIGGSGLVANDTLMQQILKSK
ncbi:hypothetical protein HK103_001939 [Boothiomyces macroporosus]|uniref:Sec1 family protein n=1 Tax=Boothiomyces macroporosus TaxID=261099 RepID=A0AAD5UJJ6_9FUNG|nr:hypothetical protein HK103_001939 [Boothiomyces macroporosus]